LILQIFRKEKTYSQINVVKPEKQAFQGFELSLIVALNVFPERSHGW